MVRADNLWTHSLHIIRPTGYWARGRPRIRWTDDIKQWIWLPSADCVQRLKEVERLGDGHEEGLRQRKFHWATHGYKNYLCQELPVSFALLVFVFFVTLSLLSFLMRNTAECLRLNITPTSPRMFNARAYSQRVGFTRRVIDDYSSVSTVCPRPQLAVSTN